jgi:predicted nucleic acid-binding protein
VIYVLDASAVVDLLVRSDPGERVREFLAAEPEPLLLTVAHLDAEVFSGLARNHRAGLLDAQEVTGLLRQLGSLAMPRVPITVELLEVAWALRSNVAARDALYVAAARGLGGRLVTTDERLARAVPDVVATVP